MSTLAQISANQKNAEHSTGLKTEEGKANSCRNSFRHGFNLTFRLLPFEEQEELDFLRIALRAEHQPETTTEILLVEKMAEHHWLIERALRLQQRTLEGELTGQDFAREFSLYMRYQTVNDRAFHKCLDQLLKLRAEKRKAEIGFESQRLKHADQTRKDSIEKRRQERHEIDILRAEAKLARENHPPELEKAA